MLSAARPKCESCKSFPITLLELLFSEISTSASAFFTLSTIPTDYVSALDQAKMVSPYAKAVALSSF